MSLRVRVPGEGCQRGWPGTRGELDPEAGGGGYWEGVSEELGSLRVDALGLEPGGVTARFLTRIPGRLSSGTAEGLKVQTERTRSMLLFANVSARHYGNYTCRAANRLGASSASMRLLRASERRSAGEAGRGGRGLGGVGVAMRVGGA